MTAYYEILFGLSIILTIIYLAIWHKHFDVHITLIFAFIPVANLGYSILAHSRNLDTALTAVKVTYIGGCFLALFICQSIFSLCHINLKRWMSVGLTLLSMLSFSFVLAIGNTPYFYKTVSFDIEKGVGRLVKTYGFAHTLTYVIITFFIVISFIAMIYSLIKKNDVSNKTIVLLMFPAAVSFLSYFIGKFLPSGIEAMPLSYVFAQVIYLIIVHRLCLYDVTDLAVETLVNKGDTGFVSIDFNDNYLGANEAARNIFPMLNKINVDSYAGRNIEIKKTLLKWLEEFKRNETKDRVYYESGEKIYLITISYLFDGKHRVGYQFLITDDTDSRKYMKLLANYNSQLSEEVTVAQRLTTGV